MRPATWCTGALAGLLLVAAPAFAQATDAVNPPASSSTTPAATPRATVCPAGMDLYGNCLKPGAVSPQTPGCLNRDSLGNCISPTVPVGAGPSGTSTSPGAAPANTGNPGGTASGVNTRPTGTTGAPTVGNSENRGAPRTNNMVSPDTGVTTESGSNIGPSGANEGAGSVTAP